MSNTGRVTIIHTRHIEMPRSSSETTTSSLEADLIDAVEQGRITLRQARAVQSDRARGSKTP